MSRNENGSVRTLNWTGVAIFGVAVLLAISGVVWLFGSHNQETPAGYVGYVTQEAVFGSTKFIGTQTGPVSTGKRWCYHVTNVSVTPYTYDEEFTGDKQVLSKDHMQISFAVHVTFRISPEKVQDFIEHYSTIQGADKPDELVKDAYANFMKERLRTFARQGIEKYNWQEIGDHISEISQTTQQATLEITKITPFDVQSVVVGNIQFPPTVAASVAEAQSASQILNRKKQEVDQAKADAEKKVAEAQGIAQAMEIVQQKLTPQYLQYLAIQAQQSMVGSPNHTTIYIPTGNMGVPLTGTFPVDGGKPQEK